MSVEYILGLFILFSTLVWTPGPNNALLASSGARFGFFRSLRHSLGVAIGFPLMMLIIALGLGRLFESFPIVREVLRFAGAAILLWIAWKIATSEPSHDTSNTSKKPWSFAKAFAFQWVNPKAWIMSISVTGQLPELEPFWLPPLIGACIFAVAGQFSAHGWVLFGVGIEKFLSTRLRFRIFNYVMAGLIVMTVFGILFVDLSH